MAAEGITCYYAPTEQKAREHAFYTWMLPGRALFDALASSYPLFLGESSSDGRTCIETFPHAVACAMAGELVSAKKKHVVRRELLERAGLSTAELSNIDEVDAALCAVAADHFARGKFKSYGDRKGGFIIVPAAASISTDTDDQSSQGASREALAEISALLPRLNSQDRLKLFRKLRE
jgi:predicted RNase H-like nuclease